MRLIKCFLTIRKGNNMICIGKGGAELEALISEDFEEEMVLSLTSEDLVILVIFSEGCLEVAFELEDRGRGNQQKGRIWRSILRLLLKNHILESKRRLPIRGR